MAWMSFLVAVAMVGRIAGVLRGRETLYSVAASDSQEGQI
jgi:hypothetical protein